MNNPLEEKQKSKGIISKFFSKKKETPPTMADKDIELPEPPHALSDRKPEQLMKDLEIDNEISNIQDILDKKEQYGSSSSHRAQDDAGAPGSEKTGLELNNTDAKIAEPVHHASEPISKPISKPINRPVSKPKKEQVHVAHRQAKPTAKAKKRSRPSKTKPIAKKMPRAESRHARVVRRVLSADKKGKIILKEKKKLEKEKRDFNKKHKKLDLLEQKLKKKEKELGLLAKKLKKNKMLLDKEEASITHKIKHLEKSNISLETKQRALKPRLSSIEQNENFLKKKINELNQREKLIIIKEEDLKKNDRLLSQKEKELLRQVKKIEHDKKMIADKETEISMIYKEMEKDRKIIAKKEDSISRKIDKLEHLEENHDKNMKELEKQEKALDTKEKKIEEKAKKASELIKESRRNRMQKESIKKMERTYTRLKDKLKEEYQKLEQVYNRRMVLEKGGTFTQKDLLELEKLRQSGHRKADIKPLDKGNLQEFVDKTSSLISHGSYVEANKYLAVLISKYHDMDDSNPFKKEAYYDILRLKHELKLALLK